MVIIPFHSFAHITSPDDQQKLLNRIHQQLLKGGTFVCGFGNPSLRQKAVDGQLRLFRKYPLPDKQGTLLLSQFGFATQGYPMTQPAPQVI